MLFNLFKKKKEEPVKPETSIEYYWLLDTQNADKFERAYKHDFDENDDYTLPAKELKEDFEGEKVYKYEPYELPMKLEGRDVYSYIKEGQWLKVGRIKKNADIDGKITLRLFPNTYKKIYSDEIEKVVGDSYFGIEVEKVLTH